MRLTGLAFVATLCVVVSSVFVQPSWGQPSGTSARPITPREVLIVRPLAYFENANGPPEGICLGARLEVGGAPAGRARIGVYEPEVSGTTEVWRATTWSASLMAAQLTGFDPRALHLSVEVGRSTDGPSAGALMTVAIVSAIRGDALREGVTMTGTINPDGTIGPVGGIIFKVDGAAQAGMKRVLIPAGLDSEFDPRTNRNVSVASYGPSKGVEVRPVSDIYQAYMEMTGVELARPRTGALPKPTGEIQQLMLERIQRWVNLTHTARNKYNSWPAYTHSEFSEGMIQQSREMFDRASQYLDEGDPTAAYMDAVMGALYSWMAHESGRYTYQLPTAGLPSLIELPHKNEWLIKEIDGTTRAMRSFQPRTFEQMAMYLNAGLAYFEGLCAYEMAEDFKRLHQSTYLQAMLRTEGGDLNSDNVTRQAMFSIFAGVFQIVAWIDMKLATDYLELANRSEGTPLPEQPNLIKSAEFYRRSAEASMAVVDGLAVIPAAQASEMPIDVAQTILSLGDGFYGAAHVGVTRVLPGLQARLGDGPQFDYVYLASSIYLHTTSAGLLAKYYSIGVEIGPDLTITKVNREQALADWLLVSRQQAEGAILKLQDQGVDVTTCLQIYWLARTEELRPKPEDRFMALQKYFYANVMAQMLCEIAKGEESVPQFQTGPFVPEPPQPLAPNDGGGATTPEPPPEPGQPGVSPSDAQPGVSPPAGQPRPAKDDGPPPPTPDPGVM